MGSGSSRGVQRIHLGCPRRLPHHLRLESDGQGVSAVEDGAPRGEQVGEVCQHLAPITIAMSIVALVCIPVVSNSAWGCAKRAGGIFGKIACWTGGIVATLGCTLLSKVK